MKKNTITAEWLRAEGFQYHAIQKYFYWNGSLTTILVTPEDEGMRWCLEVVPPHIDPREYTDTAATLTENVKRKDIENILAMCRR